MKYNILYLIDNLEYGGGERGFAQIISILNRNKYNIFVACRPGGEFSKKLSESKVCHRTINFENKYNPNVLLRLKLIIKKEKIDIVHSQGLRTDFFARIAVAMLRKRPKLVNTIQMPVEGFDVAILRKKIYQIFDRISERYVDKFITVSETLKNTLTVKHKIPVAKVIKIYNGIELDEYKPDYIGQWKNEARKELGIPENVFLIGGIGRIVWQKGFEFLIRSLTEIEKHNSKAKVLIVGDGPLRKRMEELAQHLKVQNKVLFTGFREDIKKILSAIDVLSVPSLQEGFPMITLEAMAMAKPIIATNIDGITEQITDGENGILVAPKDTEALANKITKLFFNRSIRKSMGLAARKRVEQQFSAKKMVKETERVYTSLLKNK